MAGFNPFLNLHVASQQAKRHRLVRKRIAGCGALTKDDMRALGSAASQSNVIHHQPSASIDDQIERERQRKADYQTAVAISRKIKR
jgi:hypothetical protein